MGFPKKVFLSSDTFVGKEQENRRENLGIGAMLQAETWLQGRTVRIIPLPVYRHIYTEPHWGAGSCSSLLWGHAQQPALQPGVLAGQLREKRTGRRGKSRKRKEDLFHL